MELLHKWAIWKGQGPPYILDADRPWILSEQSRRSSVTRSSWREVINSKDFGIPGDTRLHLGLLPQPFFGDLRKATVFILLLNPGLGPDDYYGEYEIKGFRHALLDTIRQKFPKNSLPFLFLNPQYAWHGGFNWWHSKLAGVISKLSREWGIPFSEARSRLGRSIAGIELIPYHSANFRDSGHWIQHLPSVQLAKAYIDNIVMPRVERKEAIVIVTRQARVWNLPKKDGVVVYSASEARAAHLTPDSSGGRAIIKHLLSRPMS
jgi:hypothetical protein